MRNRKDKKWEATTIHFIIMSSEKETTTTATYGSQQPPHEKLTPWTDDRIRFDDEALLNDVPQEEEEHPFDPFAPPDEAAITEFRFQDDSISISIYGYDSESGRLYTSTGLTVWKAATFLGDYCCCQKNQNQDHPQRILELGAGLGLNGILIHHLYPNAEMVVTDGDSTVIRECLQRNVTLNQVNDSITCRQLLWGAETSAEFAQERQQTFDCIIASDVIYAAAIVDPLYETVKTLLERPNGIFLLAFAKRRVPVTIEHVLEAATKHGLEHACVKQDEEEGLFVYEIGWRKQEEEETG